MIGTDRFRLIKITCMYRFLTVNLYSILLHMHQAEEAEELARIMMSKKTKRLYGRMQHGIEQKQDSVRRLEEKRKAIELQENAKDSKKASPSPGAKKAKSAEEKQHHGKSSGVASKVETQKTSIKKKK